MAVGIESDRLVSARDIIGAEIFNPQGAPLGRLAEIMLDKRSGEIAYVVLRFGGVLGVGAKRFPLPWPALSYEPRYQGYVVDIAPQMLEAAPDYDDADKPGWSDTVWRGLIHNYYGPPAGWDGPPSS